MKNLEKIISIFEQANQRQIANAFHSLKAFEKKQPKNKNSEEPAKKQPAKEKNQAKQTKFQKKNPEIEQSLSLSNHKKSTSVNQIQTMKILYQEQNESFSQECNVEPLKKQICEILNEY